MSVALFGLVMHPSFITGVGENGGSRFVIPGPLFPIFIIYFILVCSWTFWRMGKEYSATKGLKRNQLKYFFGGFATAYIGGAVHFLSAYTGNEIVPHDFLVVGCTVTLGYAILRLRLMDFNLIMRWGLAYFILILTISAVVIPTVLISEFLTNRYLNVTPGIITLVAVGILVFLFDPLRKRVTRFVDLMIFRSPDFQATLKGLEDVLKQTENLEGLCRALIQKLKTIWQVDHAGFVLWDYKSASFKLMPPEEFDHEIIIRMSETIKPTDYLVRTLESERRLFWQGVVVEDELVSLMGRALPGEKTTFSKIRRSMRWLGAVVCVPLMADDRLAGFIILGPKKNESLYNNEDKKFLSHVVELVALPIRLLSSQAPIDQAKQI
jgi:uncharacterized protein YigA (DUF484 family)